MTNRPESERPVPGATARLAGLALALPRADMFGPLRGGGWEPQSMEQGIMKGEAGWGGVLLLLM
mgnify:FL=1